ncbi:MAG: type II secretion system F family protein [Chloroflexota bacterium]|nr:MAG: type II secretion system protein [Chloroflexota bacterium]
MIIFIILGVMVGAGIAIYGALTVKQVDENMVARLQRFNVKPAGTLTQLELQIPRAERLLGPIRREIARRVRQITPVGTIEQTQQKLAMAGNPRNFTVQDFLGFKGMVALGFGFLAFMGMTFFFHPGFLKFVLAIAAFTFLGFRFPDLWIRQEIKKRQKEIQKYMADAIDILAISVEAGQGFDGALESLSKRKQNALTMEFDRFRFEVSAGKGRREGFRDMSLRVGVQDLNTFVAAMIQADQLGIGISQVLRTQADELRVKRRQRAEEKARQAPIKMLFPLIFLMFPALFIVILGPAIPKLIFLTHQQV